MATAVYGVGVYGTDEYGEVVEVPTTFGVREKPPLRMHLELITPSGRHYRWGEDESRPENVFGDLRHSSTMPGGYESCEVTLPRKPGTDYSDLERLSTLRVIATGGEVVGEYRLERTPRVSGDQMAISPQAVGWQAHLDDDKSARQLYLDRGFTNWVPAHSTRRAVYYAGGQSLADPVMTGDQTLPRLEFIWEGLLYSEGAEAIYDAGAGTTVARLTVGIAHVGLSSADASYYAGAASWSTDTGGSTESSGDLKAVTNWNFTPATARRFMVIQTSYVGAGAGTENVRYGIQFGDVVVYGDHGLTLRGTGAAAGYYASDVVGHAVQAFAPLLQVKPDSIQQSSFIIPHLAFLEPTTCSEIIRQASRFNLPDWCVFNDRVFEWYERGTRGKKWRARIGPSQLEETGPQLDRLWNGIIVQYEDVDGSTRTVGPTGSGADTESTDLVDSDPENPANKLGIRRRDQLQMGVSTAAGATEIGRRFLEQTKVLDSSGRATIVGWVEDDRGVTYPYSRVRAGDSISFVDASDTSYRRIVRADHTRSTRSCSIDLDAPPDGLQSLLERLGVVLVPLGL